jgi:hypothetical protein
MATAIARCLLEHFRFRHPIKDGIQRRSLAAKYARRT